MKYAVVLLRTNKQKQRVEQGWIPEPGATPYPVTAFRERAAEFKTIEDAEAAKQKFTNEHQEETGYMPHIHPFED